MQLPLFYLIPYVSLLFNLVFVPKMESGPVQSPPNIILIMADDIGFSDISSYGGEIPTPNIDRLAAEGLRFRQFYNMAKCEVSRSVMLTGLYKKSASAQSMVGLIRNEGYQTYQFGKEHFQEWVPENCYAKNNMDQSLTFWATTEYFIPPDGNFSRPFYRNGKRVEAEDLEFEQKPFYKTDVFTDYALKYIKKASKDKQPFFLFMPYHAPHYPLQARPEDIALFRGKYKVGWDVLRQKRYERMIQLGVLDNKHKLSKPTSNINKFRGHPKGDEEIRALIPEYRPWNDLSAAEKDALDLEMSVYAAMIHRLDLNIGRLLDTLDEENLTENTLIIYLSDNGACPYDSNRDFESPPGGADSYRTQTAAWSNLSNTPFKYFKQYGHEGGTHTHFIARWPKVIKNAGGFVSQPGHLVDIFPTLLEVTGGEYPEWKDETKVPPLDGTSLLPLFEGKERKEPEFFISGFGEKFRMFRKGDWKIVRKNGEPWELYNLADDMTETTNLMEEKKEIGNALIEEYVQRSKITDK